jgi:tetratricopeptide (TPR) repeat protein
VLEGRRAAILVGVVAGLVYVNSLGNGFAYDDVPIIQENPTLHSWSELATAIVRPYWPGPTGREASLWRPVTTATLGAQYVAFGGAHLPFHLLNVVLHAASAVLVFLLLGQLMTAGAALVGGLVFAVHPLHVEAVANVVGVAELISGSVVLAACLLHVRSGPSTGWRLALLLGGLYAVGFGAKESAVTLPGLIFLLDAARQQIGLRELPEYVARRWRAYFVMFVVAASMLLARLEVLGSIANPSGPLGAGLLEDVPRIWTLGEVWTHYVRLWVFPLDLAADYSPNVIPISTGWHAANVLGVLLALAVFTGCLIAWRRPALTPGSGSARAAAFGVLWFAIAVSPISNTLFVSGVLLAERTLYLPSVGLAAATGWMFVRVASRRPVLAPVLLSMALLAGAVRTWTRNEAWRDNQTTFTILVRDYPYSGRSQWVLGDNFMERGRVSEALFAYRSAVNLLGRSYILLLHVAERLIELGRLEPAERLLRQAWADHPSAPLAVGILSGVRAELGDPVGAERYARASLALHEADPLRQHVLAWALAARGAWDQAERVRLRADELGAPPIWHRPLYEAYRHQRDGNVTEVRAALAAARATVASETGRASLERIIARDFPGYEAGGGVPETPEG